MKVKYIYILVVLAFGLVYCGSENNVTGYIESGNVEEIKKLMAKDLNPRDTVGNKTYFQYAVYEGQLEILKVFYDYTEDTLKDHVTNDLLFLSIKENQKEIYHFLSEKVDFSNEPHNVSHLFKLLEEAGWDDEISKKIVINTDVNVFYDFFERNSENEDLKDVFLSLFLKQLPISEVYIGSKYDGYHEGEEYDDYGEYEEGEYYEEASKDYEYGSFSSLVNKLEERKAALMLNSVSVDQNKKKVLLGLEGDPNKLFNNFYSRVFTDDNFEYYGDSPDIRYRYTGTIARRLPYFLPVYSRFGNYFRDEEQLRKNYNTDKQLFAYFFHRIDRNPLVIKWLWEAWKKTIFSNISTKTYFRKSFYDYTEALIETYDTIVSRYNYKEGLEEAYHNLATNKCEGYIDDCIPESIQYSGSGWRIDWMWVPSFWVRRFHEGNQKEVYKILKEISAHYAGKRLTKLIQERLDKDISEASYLYQYKQFVKEGANANLLVGKSGITKLHVAALKNSLSEIKKLIAEGEDVNGRDDKKFTPIYYASKLETVKLLVENGALINDSIVRTKPIKFFRSLNQEDIATYLESKK